MLCRSCCVKWVKLQTTKNVYFVPIESRLRFGICFLDSCAQHLFTMFFSLQKTALRYLCKSNYSDSCCPVFLQHGLLLWFFFFLVAVCLMHKTSKVEMSSGLTYNTLWFHNIQREIKFRKHNKKLTTGIAYYILSKYYQNSFN